MWAGPGGRGGARRGAEPAAEGGDQRAGGAGGQAGRRAAGRGALRPPFLRAALAAPHPAPPGAWAEAAAAGGAVGTQVGAATRPAALAPPAWPESSGRRVVARLGAGEAVRGGPGGRGRSLGAGTGLAGGVGAIAAAPGSAGGAVGVGVPGGARPDRSRAAAGSLGRCGPRIPRGRPPRREGGGRPVPSHLPGSSRPARPRGPRGNLFTGKLGRDTNANGLEELRSHVVRRRGFVFLPRPLPNLGPTWPKKDVSPPARGLGRDSQPGWEREHLRQR